VRATESDIVQGLEERLQRTDLDVEERTNIEFAKEYFDKEFRKLEDEVRTSILATATCFLNQFREYQASRIFCPKKEDLTIANMDEVIDEGKILLFEIKSTALAKSMGTFIKLHYMQSLLNRIANPNRSTERCAALIIDEYQDVATVGNDSTLGDDKFFAKAKDANVFTIAASQSLTSLKNSLGRKEATEELIQHFRTRVVGHSNDRETIRNYQELRGEDEVERTSHSISEQAHHARRNLVIGGFESSDANISETVSKSEHKEFAVTGKDFARLKTFECFMGTFDGVGVTFRKMYLKPYFLEKKNIPHRKVLEILRAGVGAILLSLGISQTALGFPNVCTVVKSDEFRSCLDFSVSPCVCPGIPPRPCARISYYVPQTFVEVMPDPKSSHFGALPGAAVQLGTLGAMKIPYGAEADDDTQSFHAHTIAVPFTAIPFSLLTCGGFRIDKFCFDGMSEHLGENWTTGHGDLLQPQFLAWSLSPKACLLKGAATSLSGESGGAPLPGGPTCSIPMGFLPKYPPSSHAACNGWGTFFPRTGVYNGGSQTVGALMVASRIKSLSSEVFHGTPSSPDEVWQMIYPQSSSCFREGQNVGLLETIKNVRETSRLKSGELKGYLFVVWSKVSCCQDIPVAAEARLAVEAIIASCKVAGNL